jgi:hypothetical protein
VGVCAHITLQYRYFVQISDKSEFLCSSYSCVHYVVCQTLYRQDGAQDVTLVATAARVQVAEPEGPQSSCIYLTYPHVRQKEISLPVFSFTTLEVDRRAGVHAACRTIWRSKHLYVSLHYEKVSRKKNKLNPDSAGTCDFAHTISDMFWAFFPRFIGPRVPAPPGVLYGRIYSKSDLGGFQVPSCLGLG